MTQWRHGCQTAEKRLLLLIFNSVSITVNRELPTLPRSEILGTFCYTLIMFTPGICAYVSVTLVPASTSQSIQITTSIVSGILLFAIFWEEHITVKRIGLAGICIVQESFWFFNLTLFLVQGSTPQIVQIRP